MRRLTPRSQLSTPLSLLHLQWLRCMLRRSMNKQLNPWLHQLLLLLLFTDPL